MKAVILLTLLAVMANSSDYSIVIAKKSPISSVSAQQLRDIFLQKRHTVSDQKVIPVNVLGQEEVRTRFEAKILGMDRNRLNTYWIKQHFQGVLPPLTQPSFESVKAFVENVDGAIGYIPTQMIDAKTKVLYEF